MSMDLIEHETAGAAVGALAARGNLTLLTIAADDLPQNFLIKKMEINVTWDLSAVVLDGSQIGYICFRNADTSIANAFDARLDDPKLHQKVIWSKIMATTVFSTMATTEANSVIVTMNTSKSFPKGFPLSREDGYQWVLFNPSAAALTTGGGFFLRVRYFGVYL